MHGVGILKFDELMKIVAKLIKLICDILVVYNPSVITSIDHYFIVCNSTSGGGKCKHSEYGRWGVVMPRSRSIFTHNIHNTLYK
jgi:hypothetical protein